MSCFGNHCLSNTIFAARAGQSDCVALLRRKLQEGSACRHDLLPPAEVAGIARQLADTGIGVTVLPATDLFLMGRDQDHGVRRGVADANLLLEHGVNCSLSSNNILNPATPYGDCSLIRMANLYANVIQLDRPAQLRECFNMLTT